MLLAPGKGGDFTASPDGRFLAIVRPDTVELTNVDGTPTGSGVISYTPVMTYSEYAYYAEPVWSGDSSAVAAAIPSADPLAPAPTGSVWRLTVGGGPSLLGTIPGQFLFASGPAPYVSPDLAKVGFGRPTSSPDVSNLYWAAVDGTGETVVGPFSQWMGWAPDSVHFVFNAGAPLTLTLGDTAGGSAPPVTGTDLRWFNATEFIYLSGAMGAWTIHRGGLGLAPIPLASPAGDFIAYDFAYR